MAILPYYIANLNIEYTYKERTGRYLEFPNLCFVDTLDNMDWQGAGASGGAVQRQAAFNLGGLSEENWIRVQEQNEKPISVIIGNPPYNATQSYWNDFNPNRAYPEIDQRIRETYAGASTARNLHKQYDVYKRFIRWASDRLADDGIIGFITNRAYLDTRQDDGFRQLAAQEFTDIYVLDLSSDVRRNPKISGTTHNVFGIQTGVAIGFFVRDKAKLGECSIHYQRREDAELAMDKLAYLRNATLGSIEFRSVSPDKRNDWLNQSSSDFEQLIPIADRDAISIFDLHTPGVVTARDEWVYDYEDSSLNSKARFFADTYNGFLDANDESYNPTIKWSRNLRRHFQGGRRIEFSEEKIITSLYRPFIAKYYFADVVMSNDLTRNWFHTFGERLDQDNKVICFCVNGKDFYVSATDKPADFHFTGDTQCLPLYRYTADGERVSNITEWGRRQFREHYGDESITDEDIFAYVYAMLHDPAYRQRYEIDLRREFPRVYFQTEFAEFARLGRELLDLHLGFETVEPWPLERVDSTPARPEPASPARPEPASPARPELASPARPELVEGRPPKPILRADKERNLIRLDEETTLAGVPWQAWVYELGSRSAVEWVLDQYKERKPRDPTIRERFNTYRFADHKERVIDLLARVCTVSVKTMEIVDLKIDVLTDIDPDEGLELRPESEMDLIEEMSLANPRMPIE